MRQAATTSAAIASEENPAARSRPVDSRGSARGEVQGERLAPATGVELLAQRPVDPGQRPRGDPDRRGEHRYLAGERLEYREPEALALGRHEHGVGRVDPQRHLPRLDLPEREQRGVAGDRCRAVMALLGPGRVGGEQQVRAVRIEPERPACLGTRDRAEALEVDPAREHRARQAAPCAGWQLCGERLGGGRHEVDEPQARERDRPRAGVREVGAVERHQPPAGAGGERREDRQAEVSVDDVVPGRRARWRRVAARWPARVRRASRAPASAYDLGLPGAKLNSSTSTSPRRRRASTWSRTKLPSAGCSADGYMFVTISARTAAVSLARDR